jgi:hypothetical protein
LALRRGDCYSLSVATAALFAVNNIRQMTAGFGGPLTNINHRVAALTIIPRSEQFAGPRCA